MTLSDFCKSYLESQGVQVLDPSPKPETRAITGGREAEYVPRTIQYERSDY